MLIVINYVDFKVKKILSHHFNISMQFNINCIISTFKIGKKSPRLGNKEYL